MPTRLTLSKWPVAFGLIFCLQGCRTDEHSDSKKLEKSAGRELDAANQGLDDEPANSSLGMAPPRKAGKSAPISFADAFLQADALTGALERSDFAFPNGPLDKLPWVASSVGQSPTQSTFPLAVAGNLTVPSQGIDWRVTEAPFGSEITSPDQKAFIVLLGAHSGNDAATLAESGLEPFDIKPCHWKKAQSMRLGDEEFPSQLSAGRCERHRSTGEAFLVFVDGPDTEDLLVLAFFERDAPAGTRQSVFDLVSGVRSQPPAGAGSVMAPPTQSPTPLHPMCESYLRKLELCMLRAMAGTQGTRQMMSEVMRRSRDALANVPPSLAEEVCKTATEALVKNPSCSP
ncbi:MAG: hypothetical protein U0271_05130 [Polyangiaceae bacterium]